MIQPVELSTDVDTLQTEVVDLRERLNTAESYWRIAHRGLWDLLALLGYPPADPTVEAQPDDPYNPAAELLATDIWRQSNETNS